MRLLVGGLLLSVATGLAQDASPRAATLGKPIVRAAAPDVYVDPPRLPAARLGPIESAQVGVGPNNASAEEKYNWGVPASRTRDDSPTARLREPTKGRLTGLDDPAPGERLGEWFQDRGRDLNDNLPRPFDRDRDRDRLQFQSDNAFDDFASPVTNPFLAEDPRSLTELRPLFFFQTIPNSQYAYRGGNAYFFGLQGRVAFTDRLSLVLHKLGGMSINGGTNSLLDSSTGFSEVWLGPKFVFWRDVDAHRIGSAGLIFQMPFGSGGIYQDTGNLSLTPYFSYAQRLTKTQWGTVNLMNTVGYSFSTGTGRSDYLYNTLHVDLDAGCNHRLYPFIEMSWFHYTSNGAARPFLGFEGRDLANVGAPVSGRDFLSIAPGVRYKFSEAWQIGLATEFPLLGTRDLHQFRFAIDVIWRY